MDKLFDRHPRLERDQNVSGYVRSVVRSDVRGRNGQFIILRDSQRMHVVVDEIGAINREGMQLRMF